VPCTKEVMYFDGMEHATKPGMVVLGNKFSREWRKLLAEQVAAADRPCDGRFLGVRRFFHVSRLLSYVGSAVETLPGMAVAWYAGLWFTESWRVLSWA
jgi:hypothetical protein